MENHYEEFKKNLSKIEIDFKKLVQLQCNKNAPGTEKNTVDAKVLIQ